MDLVGLAAAPRITHAQAFYLREVAKRFDAPPPNPLAGLVVPASALAGRTAAAVLWLTGLFIECGELVLITAPGGAMKSLLMLYWACCVATGRAFLTLPDGSGGRLTRPARILWINTDNGQATHEGRLLAIQTALGETDFPLFSITITDFELSNPEHVKNISMLCDDLAIDVVVIDTISGALTGVNENSAEEMTAPAAHLRALASVGRTVIGIHHPPKADANGSRGSSVLPNKVDRVFSVARDKDLLTIKPQKVRNSPSPSFTAVAALTIDPASGALLAVNFFDGAGAQVLAEMQRAREMVLDALEAGPLNTRQVYKAVKMRKDVVSGVLSDLVATRQISKTAGQKGAHIYEKL